MEAFCGGTTLWDTELTWNDNRTWPEFTECFQDTVLVWVPSGWLWLTAPFYLHYLLQCRASPTARGWKYLAKVVLALLQLVLSVVQCIDNGLELHKDAGTFWQASFVGPMLQAVTLGLVLLLLELERRKGFVTSGVLFVYWLVLCVCSVIPFYSKIIKEEQDSDLLGFVLFFLKVACALLQLVFSCIAETVHVSYVGKTPCPEVQASFLSRITFNWINQLVVTGYKRPLTEDDMSQLNPRDKSRTVVPAFEAYWRQDKHRRNSTKKQRTWSGKARFTKGNGKVDSQSCDISESTPLLAEVRGQGSSAKEPQTSLAMVLLKTFGWQLFVSNVWKLFYDASVFVNPLLLRLLIDFTTDAGQASWKGYIIAVGFFLTTVLGGIFFHNCMNLTIVLGMRVRAALISAIFNKSLTMTNRARTESTVGQIVNLMSVDAEHIMVLGAYIWGVWSSPLQIVVCLVFLYFTVGPAMFAGLGVMVVLVPVNGFITSRVQTLQKNQMAEKDKRLKLMTEILNGIKILKLYAWEMAFGEKVSDVRDTELKYIRKAAIISAGMTFSWTVAPFTIGLATFATYIFITDDHMLDAQTAFVAISLFNVLRLALLLAPIIIMETVKAAVSVKRINTFLNCDDMDFSNVSHLPSDNAVSIDSGIFTWDRNLGPCLKNISLQIPKGSLVAVVGQVGSGKSSLVSAVLGEMEKDSGHVNVHGTTAYVPQQAWIQNATLRDNILFGKELNKSRYDQIIDACALLPDLEILTAKDMTEIGEKGINLSGGQKQRVSLARAVYFDADIYILDDPLSAVDSHVGKHIFEHVISSHGILKGKTRILVTHGVQWLPMVDQVVVMADGMVSEVGSYDQLMDHDGAFAQFLKTYLLTADESQEGDDPEALQFKASALHRLVSLHSDSATSDGEGDQRKREGSSGRESENTTDRLQRALSGSATHKLKDSSTKEDKLRHAMVVAKEEPVPEDKLIEEEMLETGRVRWAVLVSYFRAVGLGFTVLICVLYGAYQAVSVLASVWLTNWTSDSDLQDLGRLPADSSERRDRNDYYLGVYGALGVAQSALVLTYSCTAILRMVRASRLLHRNMLVNVLRCPMSFFDTTPIGRIVNRFSQDIEAIDSQIPRQVEAFLDCLFVCVSTLVVISYSTPIFLSIILPIGFLYFIAQRFYIPTSRQLKRLESKTRSPIYNNFSESLTGASVIRAFRVQHRFSMESENRVDHNHECAFANYIVNRWIGFRLEMLGSLVVLSAAIFAVVERGNISGALVGLSISYALQITENLEWLVRMTSDLETNIVSIERVRQYTNTPSEAELITSCRPCLEWPREGKMEIQAYSLRYRDGLDLVLKDINMAVTAGEKVGIVGRTGAGKSSLTLALFRIIEPAAGRILIDGEDISRLGLADLRSRLTILPQEPVLFSGSLRMNLDPLDEHGDRALWTALEHAHLKSFIETLPTGLQYEVGEGGQNLSVGQRQLVCLARSLLKKSKILVLDEATAAVDMETDDLIQNTISTEFKDCTVLTIAHRINTVLDYDRILVLEKGGVAEFDSPHALLQNPRSLFHSMARDAGLV